MKKYLSTITLQVKGVKKLYYKDEKGLDTPRVLTGFPILQQISDTATCGEEISVIAIVVGGTKENQNYNDFKLELEVLAKQIGFTYNLVTIDKEESDGGNAIISLFCNIIEKVDHDDRLYACITYGTKPVATIMNMALHYAYRLKDNVTIEAVKYGAKDWKSSAEDAGILYDSTALFYIDCLIDRIASMNLENPAQVLRAFILTEDNQ